MNTQSIPGKCAHHLRRTAGVTGFYAKRFLGLKSVIKVHLDWNMGDEIMALPLFPALKDKYPGSALFVHSRYPDLFLNNPYLDGINPQEDHFFDRLFDIRRDSKPVPRLQYWEALLGLTLKDKQPRLFFSEAERQAIRSARTRLGSGPVLAISAGASWHCKKWNPDYFRALGNQLLKKFPNLRIFELGKNCPWMGLGENLIDRTGVREAALRLAGCDLFLGNDSGLMHLAAAAGIPAIGLFGPVDPNPLVGSNARIYSMPANVDCRGCWTSGTMKIPDTCPLGEPVCMDSIRPAEVFDKVLEILRLAPGSSWISNL